MKFAGPIVVMAIALALPAYAQHGARGGFSSHGGGGGHAGFAGRPGFSGSRGFSRPSSPVRSNGFARPNNGYARQSFGHYIGQPRPGFRIPYQGRGISSARPPYRPGIGDRGDRRRGGDRDRRFRPWLGGGYGFGYPGWLGYPYVIDPGFFDWGSSDEAGDAQALAPNYPDASGYAGSDAPPDAPQYPADPAPYPAQGLVPQQPYAGSAASSAAVAEEPLTVMFRNGRAPETMQNYMLSSNALTDLDRQHYERIPLNQVDVAATQKANRTHGVDFEIPMGTRE